MNTLTQEEEKIFLIINDFIKKNKYSPTIREICKLLGGRSTATVHYHLKKLREKKFINYLDNVNRTITIN